MRQRVLFITLHFPPGRSIGASACEQIARYFPLYGWYPYVLTRPKDQYERIDPEYRRPFPGTVVEARTLPHPVTVYRKIKGLFYRVGVAGAPDVPDRPAQSYSRIRRWILSMLHLPDIYTSWILPATIVGLRTIRREGITALLSSGPFWTNHLVGVVLSRLTGLPLIAHFRDPWIMVPQPKPVSALSMRIERRLHRLVVETAESVVCVTDAHTRAIRARYPDQPIGKFVTIPNGYDGEEWERADVSSAKSRQFVISYPGGFVPHTRSPRPVFRALRHLIDAGEIDPGKVAFNMFGYCEMAEGMRVADMAAQYGLQNVAHVGTPVSRQETIARIAQSDLLLLLAEGWTLQIPGKTYEYLRAGRPMLALTSRGALAEFLKKTGGAWVAEPDDQTAIVCALREAYNAWRCGGDLPKADAHLIADYDRRRLAGRFAFLFEAANARTRPE